MASRPGVCALIGKFWSLGVSSALCKPGPGGLRAVKGASLITGLGNPSSAKQGWCPSWMARGKQGGIGMYPSLVGGVPLGAGVMLDRWVSQEPPDALSNAETILPGDAL